MSAGSQDKPERVGVREQSKIDVMRRIQDAAAGLLAERPFPQITTREVARAAGIGEATLFRYVATKDELLTLVYGDQMDALLDELSAADTVRAQDPGPHDGAWYCERVRSFYEGRASFYLREPVNASLYLRQGFDVDSAGRHRPIEQGDRLIAQVAGILAAGQSAGVLLDSVDPKAVAQNCHGIFIHEVDRTPTRGFAPATIWERVSARLDTQLIPLIRAPRS